MVSFTRGSLVVLATGVVMVGAGVAQGADGVLVKNVPATFEFRLHSGGTTPCGAAGFIRWKSVAGATSATAKFRSRSAEAADTNGPFSDATATGQRGDGTKPPFENTFLGVYTVEPGYDWLNAGVWMWGGSDQGCADGHLRGQRMIDQAAGVQVTLTIQVPGPVVKSVGARQLLPRSGNATVATLKCPVGGTCTVKAPRFVTVFASGRTYRLGVTAPRALAGGKSANVVVRFPRAATRDLAGRTVRPRVKVEVSNQKVAKTSLIAGRSIRVR